MKDILSLSVPLSFILLLATLVDAITVYPAPDASPILTGDAAAWTQNVAAYNTLRIPEPPLPQQPSTSFDVHLTQDAPQGLSIPQRGDFFGFSVELSVADQIFGKNGSILPVPLLNLLHNLELRGGSVRIRVGGNSQERAETLKESLPGGLTIQKHKDDPTNPTETPRVIVGIDLIYAMANISSLVNAKWYLGVPFNDTTPRLAIAELGEQLLGDSIIGFQVGNEPDLYGPHGARAQNYSQTDYINEWGIFVRAIAGDDGVANKSRLIGPSVCCGLTNGWTPESMWDAGFLTTFKDQLSEVSVEHYPTDNCGISPRNSTDLFDTLYLNHQSVIFNNAPYVNSAGLAAQNGKDFIMMETNTASCSGFPGLSNSFGAVLWGIDHALSMASIGFTNAMFHIGGQKAFYNAFTPPPTNQSRFHQWTMGSMYYSALAVSETFGKSNKSRIMDLFANNNNSRTPAYVVYEDGIQGPTKVALFNFNSDPSGANDYTANIQVGGGDQPGASPSQVFVRYMLAPNGSVSDTSNFTWAGQTMGDVFGSDGRLYGQVDTQTVQCNNNVCSVKVKAPAFALVFFNDQTLKESTPENNEVTATFSTTAVTALHNTATIAQAVLATSNGRGGHENQLGSTSFGSVGSAVSITSTWDFLLSTFISICSMILGAPFLF